MSTTAQNKNRERIKMLKVSFISNAIDLTPKEAEKFWPIYNKHEHKIIKLKSKIDSRNYNFWKNKEGIDSLSDEKAKELIQTMLNTENEIVKTKKQLVEDLYSAISAKKILKLQIAERNFNKRMLQEFGKRRRMNMKNK